MRRAALTAEELVEEIENTLPGGRGWPQDAWVLCPACLYWVRATDFCSEELELMRTYYVLDQDGNAQQTGADFVDCKGKELFHPFTVGGSQWHNVCITGHYSVADLEKDFTLIVVRGGTVEVHRYTFEYNDEETVEEEVSRVLSLLSFTVHSNFKAAK